MSDVVDRLEVKVEAEAQGANKQLNKLVGNLEKVSSSLGTINAGGLQGLANGVQKLSNSMLGMKNVGTADFTRLTKNIGRLGSINAAGLNSAASSMAIMGKSLGGLGKVSENAVQLGELSKSISKLGNKGVTNAITNIPQLADALNKMMGTLSRSPQVNKNLIQMTNSLANLASQGSKVSSATKSINSSFKSYSSATDKATKSSKSFASAVGMLYARFWMLKRAAQAMFKSVESSMDFLETVNYFEVAIGKIGKDSAGLWQENGYNSAEEYAASFSGRLKELTSKMTGFEIDVDGNATMSDMKSLGLNPDKVMQNQAVYAQMADSLGLCGETAINTSKAFTMLGADWASLRNISLDTAWEKFASAMAGQSRAVRSLGIDITMATLQETAYKYGLTQAVQEMNQATKAQLRLLTIMNQSTVAFGDMANTISAPANQLRILQQNFANLSRIIGNLFLPVIAKVLPYINGLVIAMQRLFTWVGGLLGIKFDSINSAIGGAGDGIGDVVGGVGDLEEGLEDANAAAKKLKTTTLGIDELNINAPQEDSGGKDTPVGGGNPILDGAIADALAEYEKVWNDAFNRMDNKAKEIADNIANYFGKIWKSAENTRVALKNLWNQGFAKLADFSGKALLNFYEKFLVPVGKWALGEGIPELINHLNYLLKKMDWNKLSKQLDVLWDGLAPFAISVGRGLVDFIKDMMSFGASAISAMGTGLELIGKGLKWINDVSPGTVENLAYGIGILFTSLFAYKTLLPAADALNLFVINLRTFFSIAQSTSIGNAFSQMLGGLIAHPYLAGAIAFGGFVAVMERFRTQIFENSAIGQYIGDLDKVKEGLDNATNATDLAIQKSQEKIDQAGDEGLMVEGLYDRYETLASKSSLTNEEYEEMKILVDSLKEKVPELSKHIDEETGLFDDQSTAIRKCIDNYMEYYYAKAAEENIIELMKNNIAVQTELSAAQEKAKEVQEMLNEKRAEFNAENTSGVEKQNTYAAATDGLTQKQVALNGEITALSNAMIPYSESIENAESALADSDEQIQTSLGYITKYQDSLGETQNVADSIDYANMLLNSANSIDSMGGIWDNGKQILGEKALAIQEEVLKRLTPDENGVYTLAEGMTISYGDGAESGIEKAVSTIDKPFLDKLKGMLPEGYSIGEENGKYYVTGFNDGMSKTSKETQDAVNRWCDIDINKATKEGTGVHSPSTITYGFGMNYVFGFNNGILDHIWTTTIAIGIWATRAIEKLNSSFGENFTPTFFETAFSTAVWTEKLNIWFESISPFFTLEKWEMLLSNTVLSFTNSWDKISKDTLKQLELMGINISKSIDLQNKTLDIGMQLRLKNWGLSWDNMNSIATKICSEIQRTVKLMSDGVKNECDNVISKLDEVSRKIASIGSGTAKVGVSFNVPQFAGGGFPDTGELFMARENGINEFVGAMGNRSVVVNNEQITDSIRDAVVQGMHVDEQNALLIEQNALIKKQNELSEAILEKEGKVVFDTREGISALKERSGRNGIVFC